MTLPYKVLTAGPSQTPGYAFRRGRDIHYLEEPLHEHTVPHPKSPKLYHLQPIQPLLIQYAA